MKNPVLIENDTLTAIGNAIREKAEITDKILPKEMPQQIKALSGEKTYISENGHMYTKHIEFPENLVNIANNSYIVCRELESVHINSMSGSIGAKAFYGCSKLKQVVIEPGCKKFETECFNGCTSLVSINIPNTVTSLLPYILHNTKVETLTLPSSITECQQFTFAKMIALKELHIEFTELPDCTPETWWNWFGHSTELTALTVPTDFNVNNFSVSGSPKLPKEVLVNILNNLKNRTEESAYNLKLGTTNLAKLSDEEKIIAINKNWNLT